MTQEDKAKPEGDKVSSLEARLAQLEKRASDQDRTISRKEEENRKLRDELITRNDTADLSKAAFALLAGRTDQSEEEVETAVRRNQPNLAKQFEDILETSKQKRERESQVKVATEMEKRITALGFARGTPEHYEVFGRLAMGDTEGAYSRIEELEARKSQEQKPATGKIAKSVDDILAERLEEEKRKWLEDQGRLVSETGTTIAGATTKGKAVSLSELKANRGLWAKEFPNPGDFEKAMAEGRITE